MKNILFIIIIAVSIAAASCTRPPKPALEPPLITSFTPASDTANGTITITGTGFADVTAVSIGGTPEDSFTVVNATTITVIINPATGSTGVVSVTTPAGTATLTGFIYPPITPCGGGCYISSDLINPSDLIGYWPFNGDANDSISGLSPILSGGTAIYVVGRRGQAIQLTNGWFTYPAAAGGVGTDNTGFGSNDTLQNGFTISLWVKQLPDTSTLTTLFQLSSPIIPGWPLLGIQYRKHTDSTVDLDPGFSNVDGDGPQIAYANLFHADLFKDTGTWAFIALVYDTSAGRYLNYYYNGSLAATADVSSYFILSATEPLQMIAPNYISIGISESDISTPGDVSNAPLPFMAAGITATIDDIRFFKVSLSASKISYLYLAGMQGR